MPSPVRFSQEVILEESFKIVRSDGPQALSARRLAQNLNCSTQPVYSAFGSMKKLQEAVEKKAYALFVDYLLQGQLDNDPFLSMGLRYLRFAREEKTLFRTFFLEGEMALTIDKIRGLSAPLIERMKQDPSLQKLSDAQLDRIGGDMWVYTHGLAALTFQSEDDGVEAYVREKLSHMGDTVIEWEYRQSEVAPEENDFGDER